MVALGNHAINSAVRERSAIKLLALLRQKEIASSPEVASQFWHVRQRIESLPLTSAE
jgi:hypothetical protein